MVDFELVRSLLLYQRTASGFIIFGQILDCGVDMSMVIKCTMLKSWPCAQLDLPSGVTGSIRQTSSNDQTFI